MKGAQKMEIELNCTLKEKLSKKGSNYYVMEVELTPNCIKQVFLEPSEIELVKLYFGANKKTDK